MGCAICGQKRTEGAHVKPHASFPDRADDRDRNIIPLCPNHHEAFDDGLIGIAADKRAFIVLDAGFCTRIESTKDIRYVKDRYVEE